MVPEGASRHKLAIFHVTYTHATFAMPAPPQLFAESLLSELVGYHSRV